MNEQFAVARGDGHIAGHAIEEGILDGIAAVQAKQRQDRDEKPEARSRAGGDHPEPVVAMQPRAFVDGEPAEVAERISAELENSLDETALQAMLDKLS